MAFFSLLRCPKIRFPSLILERKFQIPTNRQMHNLIGFIKLTDCEHKSGHKWFPCIAPVLSLATPPVLHPSQSRRHMSGIQTWTQS